MNSEHYIFRRTYFAICDDEKNEKLRKRRGKKKEKQDNEKKRDEKTREKIIKERR